MEKVNLQTEILNQQEDVELKPAPKSESSEETSKPEPKHIVVRDNQTGISYRRLFGDYLKGVTTITLTDPYIRLPYQFKNLVEFCIM